MITPATYASRYLPVPVPVPVSAGVRTIQTHVRRYHVGPPTAVQQQLWGALIDHFAQHKKTDPGYMLDLTVNDTPYPVRDHEQLRMHSSRPFWGKGSPEDCQIVLQLALRLALSTPDQLQRWADANIGLDCNGFVGNYLCHVRLGKPWSTSAGNDDPGPSQTIDKLFWWAAGRDEHGKIDDLDDLDASRIHLVVRTASDGSVIAGPNPVGHVALTEPRQVRKEFTTVDLTRSGDGMIGNLALRTVESAGPVDGVGQNWMVFVRPLRPNGVFQVNRDKIRFVDPVKIAPLPPV
jgi:hypothetical protein